MRHTVEEKLNAIGMVKSGMTPRSVSRILHLGHHALYEWIAAYEEKGISGLKNKLRTRKNQLSFEKKQKIVLECQQSDLPLYQISTKYGIAESTLSSWLTKVEQFGMDSLARKKSIKKDPGTAKTKRLPKDECEKELKLLRKENERLRAENLLLKKVKALVVEREAQNRRCHHPLWREL